MTCAFVARPPKQDIVIEKLYPRLSQFLRTRALKSSVNCCSHLIWPPLCGLQLHNGSYESSMRHLSAMISQMRLLGRRRLVPRVVPSERQYSPTVCPRPHTTAIPTKPLPTATRATRQLPTRPILPLSTGGRRNASYEAGENDSGHINTGPNEGIFFFDSELIQTPA